MSKPTLHLVSKKSGKITIHAEITGFPCQAWACYGFRAHGINTFGLDIRDVTGQKNIKGYHSDFKAIETTPEECDKQRLIELCARPYYSDFDEFWETQGKARVNRDEIKAIWQIHHAA